MVEEARGGEGLPEFDRELVGGSEASSKIVDTLGLWWCDDWKERERGGRRVYEHHHWAELVHHLGELNHE